MNSMAEALDAGTVLIVDDEPYNLALLHSALDDAGYRVLVALDGHSAMQRIERRRPDLILLDAVMPGMNGFETCRNLKAKAELSDIPVLFMTALTESSHVIDAFEAGAVDYVTKPIECSQLLARVGAHLRTAQRLRMAQAGIAQPLHALDDDSAARRVALRFSLTEREQEVLRWLACGKTNRDIGDILGLSPRTINKHLEHIYVKLGVETRAAATSVALSGRVG